MDTLIVVCLVLSSSLAAPQQYVLPTPPGTHQLQNPRDFNPVPRQINNVVPPNQLGQVPSSATAPQQYVLPTPPGSNQLQNPRDFNPLPGQINNVVSPNQVGQAPSSATASVQQAFLSMHNSQGQSSFGLQAPQNNQNPSLISLQENTETNNEYGQTIQNGFGNINNANSDVLNNDFVSNYGSGNGQTTISNIGFNNNLNNPIRVTSSIGHFNQGTDNLGLPITDNGNPNAINGNNDLNNPIRVTSSIGHFNQGTNNPGLPITDNGNPNVINGNNVDPNANMNELLANNLAGPQHLSIGDNTHVNGNAVFDVNTQGLSSNLNSANSEISHFSSGQSDNSQNNEQLFPHQNLHSNQNLNNNNAHVDTVGNFQLNNEFNLNQGIQDTGNNQSTEKDNTIIGQQKNEVNSRCGRGLVPNARGACVHPEVSRNIFVYAAPKMSHNSTNTSSEVPRPKIEYNLVFVRTPKANGNGEPIIVPPPQQKTLVYVLSKNNANGAQEIIEVPAGPQHNPEVFYVNYEEGDNPILPGGIELQTALSTAAQTGQTVNDVLSNPLLREDISHDNIASTGNTGSKIKDTMFNGINLHETAEGNLANTLTNNPNNEESYNNDGNANNQLDHTSNEGVQSNTGVGSDIDFINNGVGLQDAGRIAPQNVHSFDGPLSTGDLRVPSGNGINTGSVPFVTNGEVPKFIQALPNSPRVYNKH